MVSVSQAWVSWSKNEFQVILQSCELCPIVLFPDKFLCIFYSLQSMLKTQFIFISRYLSLNQLLELKMQHIPVFITASRSKLFSLALIALSIKALLVATI